MRSEIERLRTEQRQGHALLRALTNDDPDRWDAVLDRMRAGDPPETIAESILAHSSGRPPGASGQAPNALINTSLAHGLHARETFGVRSSPALGQPMYPFTGPFRGSLPVSAPPLRRFSLPSPLCARQPPMVPPYIPELYAPRFNLSQHQHFPPSTETLGNPSPNTWTRVTSDARLVDRLLAKFFTSSLPFLSLVSRRQFMHDFREGNHGYCSEALVNAILGMASKVATTTSQLVSRVSFGDAFMGEARALLARGPDCVNLPCIQALGILALAEMAQGNEEEANDLARESVRACIRFLLQTQQPSPSPDDDFRTVRALAYCGGFSLTR